MAVITTTQCGAGPCAGNSPFPVNFDGTGSNSLDGLIVSYEWDFGDPLSGAANSSEAAVASHVFTIDQVHTVRLTVTDDIGLTGTALYPIDVTVVGPPPPTAVFAMSIETSPGSFSPLPSGSSVVRPQHVVFDGSASHDSNNDPVSSYYWDFGDGTTATGNPPPVHLYESLNVPPGEPYTISLTVTAANGTTATTTQTLVVKDFAPPNPVNHVDAAGEWLFNSPHAWMKFGWTNGPSSPGEQVEVEIQVEVTQGCILFPTQSKRFPAGAEGQYQVERWDFWVTYSFPLVYPTHVCLGSKYRQRARTVRTNAYGTFTSSWSSWSDSWWIGHL